MRFRSILLALSLVLAAAPAPADDAESHFKRGVQLYQETDYKAAAIEFRRAYEMSHRWGVLYNRAQAEFQALDYAGALSTFERYLSDGGERVPKARRAEVDREIAKLRARVGRVTLQVLPAGAEVAIDDVKVGTAPFDKEVLVSAGARKVTVTKEGFRPNVATIEIAGGDAPKVEVTLEPNAPVQPSPVQPVTPPPPPPPRPVVRRVPWELWLVSGGLAAAAAVTGVLALKASSDLDNDRARFGVQSSDLSSGSSRVKAFSIASDVLVVGALAVAGVALYMTLRPGTRVGIGPRGALVAGSF